MAGSRYNKYESTSDGVCECISAFIFVCERRSPKCVSRNTFLFFFLATLATLPPPRPPHNIFHGGFLTLQPENGIYFAPAPQNHVNDYAMK